jgi:hypothetical protein
MNDIHGGQIKDEAMSAAVDTLPAVPAIWSWNGIIHALGVLFSF